MLAIITMSTNLLQPRKRGAVDRFGAREESGVDQFDSSRITHHVNVNLMTLTLAIVIAHSSSWKRLTCPTSWWAILPLFWRML